MLLCTLFHRPLLWLAGLESLTHLDPGRVARAPGEAIVRVAAAFPETRFRAVLRTVRTVGPRVLVEVVGAHEPFVANRALEPLLPGVRA